MRCWSTFATTPMSFGSAQPHPSPRDDSAWSIILDALRVPFLAYTPDGRRDHMSPSAVAVFTARPQAMELLLVADRIAADEIARGDAGMHIGRFAFMREIECPAAGLALDLFRLSGTGEHRWRAVAVARPMTARDAPAIAGLSRRETEVARLISAGLSTKEIACRLEISSHTVRHHTERIFARLHVSSRAEVAAIVAEWRVRRQDAARSHPDHRIRT